MVFPVVERELRVAARRRSTYRVRLLAVIAMMAGFGFAELVFLDRDQSPAEHGQILFQIFSWLALTFAGLAGLLGTADCMSAEKREGTLGLLFLTDLKGYDVICGKLAANSVSIVYALLASVPILSLPIIMGGVGAMQFIKVTLILLTVLALSCAVGVFISTNSRNERKAMVFAVLTMLAIVALPLVVAAILESKEFIADNDAVKIANLSPVFSMGLVLFASRMGMPNALANFMHYHVWITLTWLWLLAAFFLASAARKAPGSWQEGEAAPRLMRRKIRWRFPKWQPPRALLDGNAYQWLALRGETTPRAVWGFVIAMLGIWGIAAWQYGRMMLEDSILLPTVVIVNGFLKIWVVGEASRRFVEDRQNNALELLLSTPLNQKDLMQGQWRALLKLFALPMLAVVAWEFFALAKMKTYGGDAPMGISSALFLGLDSVALAWLGMWYALKFSSRIRVMLTCVGLVLIIPLTLRITVLVLVSFAFEGRNYNAVQRFQHLADIFIVGAMILFDAAVIYRSRVLILRNLRRLAVERFGKG